MTITPSVLTVWKQVVLAQSFRTTRYLMPKLNVRSSILISNTVETWTKSRNKIQISGKKISRSTVTKS